jgi:putative methylase
MNSLSRQAIMQSKKQLAVLLSKLKPFESPKLMQEQYTTDSEIAAEILWNAHMQGEIEGKSVADLGSGTGILGIGALVLGAKHVDFVEIDEAVLPALMSNLHDAEIALNIEFHNYEIIVADISTYNKKADLVLQNPPFGTKQKHADLQFLEKAIQVAPIIYSFHKAVTEEYLQRWAQQHNLQLAARFPFSWKLKQTMAHHEKKRQEIQVVCLKFVVFLK